LAQHGDAIRDGWIKQTIRAASPFDCRFAAGFSLEDTQQERGVSISVVDVHSFHNWCPIPLVRCDLRQFSNLDRPFAAI
jgi:hypothetical protein